MPSTTEAIPPRADVRLGVRLGLRQLDEVRPPAAGGHYEYGILDALAVLQGNLSALARSALRDRNDPPDLRGAVPVHEQLVELEQRFLTELVDVGNHDASERGEVGVEGAVVDEDEIEARGVDFLREFAGDERAARSPSDNDDVLLWSHEGMWLTVSKRSEEKRSEEGV